MDLRHPVWLAAKTNSSENPPDSSEKSPISAEINKMLLLGESFEIIK